MYENKLWNVEKFVDDNVDVSYDEHEFAFVAKETNLGRTKQGIWILIGGSFGADKEL